MRFDNIAGTGKGFPASLLKALLLGAVALLPLFAQTGASRIRGVVADSSGGVIAGASVTAKHVQTGLTRTMVTIGSGEYSFDAMPVGPYVVTATMAGFKTAQSAVTELEVGIPLTVDLSLVPGSMSEQITVSDTNSQVETAEASVGKVIGAKPIEELPLDGRNPLLLMELLPGVSGHSSASQNFSVNGDRGRGVYTTLDGVDITDPVIPNGAASQVSMNPDSVGEYRVITNLAKAEYGRNSGAQVQIVTRSGTNRLHGNLFEFDRNDDFNANDWFNNRSGLSRALLKRNQFGASLGGPILRNKIFFFVNWQSQRLAQSIPYTDTVLTAQARQGIFRYMVGAANSAADVNSSGQPVVSACSATVTTGCYRTYDMVANDPLHKGLDPLTQSQINLTSLPNDFSAGDGFNTAVFRFNSPSSTPSDNYTGKLDYHIGSNQQAFLRWSKGNTNTLGDYVNGGLPKYPNPKLYPGRTSSSDNLAFSVGLTSVITSTMVNEFNMGYTSSSLQFLDPTHPGLEVIANIESDPYIFWGGTGRTPIARQGLDNFSFSKGNHTFKTGANLRFYSVDQFRRATNFYPRLTFSTANAPVTLLNPATGINSVDQTRLNSMFNDLMGVVGTVQKVFYSNGTSFPSAYNQLRFHQRTNEYNFYFQDDWRITPRLTLNLGLRYEFNGVPYDSAGMQVVNNKPLNSPSADVAFLPAGPGTGRSWYNNDYKNFAPVASFAWTPFADGKTSIRGGYRIAYDRLVSWALNVVEQNQPGTTVTSIIRPNSTSPTVRAGDPIVQTLIAQLSNGIVGQPVQQVPPSDRSSTPLVFDSNLRTPYVNQWNLSIQRQIFHDTILEVAYVGSESVHLFQMINANQSVVSPDFVAGFKAAQSGVRTGVVGKILDTYGATLPSSVAAYFTNNDIGGFVNSVDTSVFNNVTGGRLTAAGLSQSYFHNPQFSVGAVACTCSTSSYNSLQISLNRRFSRGLMAQVNYSFAKSLDDVSDDTNGAGTTFLLPRDSTNVRLDRGRSAFDVRHQLRGGIIYELPFGKGKPWLSHGLAAQIAGGWTTSTIIDVSSGRPFTVVGGYSTVVPGTISNADFNGSPASIGGVTRNGSSVTYFSAAEKAMFSPAGLGDLGAGRNIFTGPGFFQTDFAIHRIFAFRERVRLEIRGEAFNVFNNVNFALPNATLTSASFGVISSTLAPPRVLQLAAKLTF
jgi:hypothetical protein